MEEHARIFTRGEANDMIPRLRPLLEELRDEWGRIKALNPEIRRVRDRAMYDGFHPRGVEYVEAVSHLTSLISEIRTMGVLVKDLDRGLCDFPYVRADRVVYLCWHLGEESIGFWHDTGTGFGGREPLGDEDV
jgi:hypothetical protein